MGTRETVGFIGLGNIGMPIAERIACGGFNLVAWNRSPGKLPALVAKGAEAARSARDLGTKSDIVFLCVDTASALEEVLFGFDGLVGQPQRTSLVVDLSTMPPALERELGARLKRSGIALIDVPVSGGASGARAGSLAAMCGGEASDLERARPIIETFANRITHMGPLGAGQAAKACNQIISIGTMGAIAEALAVGNRNGVDTNRLPDAVSGGFGDSRLMQELKRSLQEQDGSAVRFIIEALRNASSGVSDPACKGAFPLVLKDLGIALDLGREAGVSMPLTAHMDSVFRSLHQPAERPPGN